MGILNVPKEVLDMAFGRKTYMYSVRCRSIYTKEGRDLTKEFVFEVTDLAAIKHPIEGKIEIERKDGWKLKSQTITIQKQRTLD